MQKHELELKSTPYQIAIAEEASDWLIDAVAGATQDRRFLRGDPEFDEVVSGAIKANGKIACLRALNNLTDI